MLLKKKSDLNVTTNENVLTRTPFVPGLPCGPAAPCNEGKTSEVDLFSDWVQV